MKLLILSNGHGEDVIAIRIIKQLQQLTSYKLKLAALPIVGEGHAYTQSNIPIVGKVRQMPSGGFIYMESNNLWQDVRGGLIGLTIEQIRLVRKLSKEWSILAVGDIVPLLYAWLSSSNFAFVGTAKSEYYLRDETGWLPKTSSLERWFGSVYLPWERWLMANSRCKAVFPRDTLTAKILQRWSSISTYDLGNPMMDDLECEKPIKIEKRRERVTVLLLPGSRMPESLHNWQQIISAVSGVIDRFSHVKLEFLAAIAPNVNLNPFVEYVITQGWYLTATSVLTRANATLYLTQNAYACCLQQADIAIAMAGTATEQFVGLGKPVVTMPGKGPQFTYAFAEAQTRLLGCSVILVANERQVANTMFAVLNNPQQLEAISTNGKRRMGSAGASKRIALCLQEKLLERF
ncbi:lipid-A-disaccharide synthase-related protein [Myxosarcina sp. GI1]|uniref:lipid-A-disaccharide synthase-related protein n=1 Tax=Myxosarcina sp. GI1 TaxID=1541065 RepID=UPI00055F184F|nr:lipid-A-disaccharide synthase-related protein [Myxosarcina sp. GI1]